MNVSLLSFLSTGTLGDVKIGSTEMQVRKFLGDPEVKGGGSRKYRKENIWKYGDMEIGFHPKLDELTYIAFIFWNFEEKIIQLNKGLSINSGGIYVGIEFSEFEEILNKNKMQYKKIESTNEGTYEIIIENNVTAIFNIDKEIYEDEIGLQKLVTS